MGPFLRCVAVVTALAACGDTGDDVPDVDLSEPLFDPAHLVEVDITIDEADWDELRAQTRSWVQIFGTCLTEPFADPFTYFPGSVIVDGQELAEVGVRKKGFLGSLDTEKPSLKIKFDEYVVDQRLFDLKGLTLNNAKQDPAFVRQCLSYATFAAAGIPAPRCNFAHVRVNGRDLGLYVNVEAVNKPFLRRHFDDDEGNLYEGTLSDFRDGWTATFELKTNETANDRSDLDAVVAALEGPDDGLVGAVDAVVDLDQFTTFWAAETLVTHWDGYTGNANNFFAYHDPTTDRFQFMPWGADGTFIPGPDPYGNGVVSVQAVSLLPYRLYQVPATRDRYVATLRALLDQAWDETHLLAEVDRMEDLITPVADPDGTVGLAARLDEVRSFVEGRRGAILAELDAGPPAWTVPLRDPPCFETIGSASGSLQTTWGTAAQDAFAAGTGTLAATVESTTLQVSDVGSNAGWDPDDPTRARLLLVALLADGTAELVVFQIAPDRFVPGASLPIDWVDVVGVVYHFVPATNTFTLTGLIGDGTLDLAQAATSDGAPVRATFTGTIVRSPF